MSNSNRFNSKPILITGCSSGIGLAAAQGLKLRGYQVFTTARKPEDLQMLRQQGLSAHFMDYSNSQSIMDTLEWVLKQTDQQIYALFNNGAYGQPGAIEDLTRNILREQFEANVFGWQELTNLVIPHMRKAGEGRIIHNSSVLGFIALKYRGAYNASKFALEGLTDTMRLELKHSNIYVSLIQPGPITSQFRAHAYKKFVEHIQPLTHSAHADTYKAVAQRLSNNQTDKESRFTLLPEAVLKPLIHALENKSPQSRYPVTLPTHVFTVLKRLLPTRLLDTILARSD